MQKAPRAIYKVPSCYISLFLASPMVSGKDREKAKTYVVIMQARSHSTKRKNIRIVFGLLVMNFYLVFAKGTRMQEKAESTVPIITLSPPEGNTTFLGGTTWCVARPGAPQADLQIALDWACGLGMADCRPIKSGGNCFQPDTLVSHASYAFNSYYQKNGNSDIACNFGGTGILTKHNPSYGHCVYAASGSTTSASPPALPEASFVAWELLGLLLLLYFRM